MDWVGAGGKWWEIGGTPMNIWSDKQCMDICVRFIRALGPDNLDIHVLFIRAPGPDNLDIHVRFIRLAY